MKHKVTALECRYLPEGRKLILHTKTPRGTTVRFDSVQFSTKGLSVDERTRVQAAAFAGLFPIV